MTPVDQRAKRRRPRGLTGLVLDDLGRRIVQGELAVGDHIDPEQLVEQFAVSRTVVREALRVLASKGLVEARQKLGTFVAPRRGWLLLDVDVMRWRTEGTIDTRLVEELGQIRSIIEPAAARAAATRRTPEQLDDLKAAYELLASSFHERDHASHIDADVDFHVAILQASDNELMTQLEVVLEPAMRARHHIALTKAESVEFLEDHRAVMDHIVAGDPDAAEAAMRQLIERAAREVGAIISQRGA